MREEKCGSGILVGGGILVLGTTQLQAWVMQHERSEA